MNGKEEGILYFGEEDIARYVYTRLLEYGYAPDSDEVEDIAEIFFDFLLDNDVFEVVAIREDELGEEED